jgi:predicted kinase
MKKLILLRGPQGSGKSTWLKATGLDGYSLSLDQVRLAMSGLVLDSSGRFGLNQELNEPMVHLFHRLADERMERGELLVIEQALMDTGDIRRWMEKADFHRYSVCLVDLSNMPEAQVLLQNASRPDTIRVSEGLVRKSAKRLQDSIRHLPAGLLRFPWEAGDAHWTKVDEWLKVPVRDLSHYKKIIHIGDLQGCLTVLTGRGGLLENGLEDGVHYIFMGDLLDRGLENGAVMAWAMKHIVGNPHVTLIWGNHEDHPHRWARGQKHVSHEFAQKTLPQLLQHGMTSEDADRLCAHAVEVLPYSFHGHLVLASHAGLSTVPERLERVSGRQLSKGTGQWSDPIDQQFERQAPHPWVQVHGHRNHNHQAIQATPRSFSLEDRVEYGGTLRTATLTPEGWTTKAYPNPVFLLYRNRHFREEEKATMMPWMKTPSNTHLSAEELKVMRDHEGVREKTSVSSPHVASFNFTKDVFFNQSWDDVVVRARGLFFNTTTGEIVARAYDKFFNYDEPGIAETKPDHLAANLQFPIVGYSKENGYLGLVGYDAQTDSLFLTSKSTPDSDFAGWFKDIFERTIPETQREELRRTLRDQECCCVFEVNDPVRDRGHMIAYADQHLVLLDVFARTSTLQKLDHEALQAFGRKFGFSTDWTTPGNSVKRREVRLPNWQAFEKWHEKVDTNLDHKVGGQYTEGVVFEDAAGFQFKIKYPYYAFWKTMRGAKEHMRRTMEKTGMKEQAKSASIESVVSRHTHPLATSFLEWCKAQTPEALKAEVIDLRARFEQEVVQDPSWVTTPWSHKANVQARILADKEAGQASAGPRPPKVR